MKTIAPKQGVFGLLNRSAYSNVDINDDDLSQSLNSKLIKSQLNERTISSLSYKELYNSINRYWIDVYIANINLANNLNVLRRNLSIEALLGFIENNENFTNFFDRKTPRNETSVENLSTCSSGEASTRVCTPNSHSLQKGELSFTISDSSEYSEATLVFLDWDDTLFPTSNLHYINEILHKKLDKHTSHNMNKTDINYVKTNSVSGSRASFDFYYPMERWSTFDRISFRLVEKQAIDLIISILKYTKNIYIVSDASYTWIHFCLKSYYQKFDKILKQYNIRTISTRDELSIESNTNNNTNIPYVGSLKKATIFLKEAATFQDQIVIIVSIGDSENERIAAYCCSVELKNIARFASIKQQRSNSAAKQRLQLCFVGKILEPVLSSDSNIDFELL